jgi:hypothetical protein
VRRLSGERRLAGQHLEQHTGQGVDVSPPIDVRLTLDLLGRHISGRADRNPGAGQRLFGRVGFGDAEVGDERVIVGEQDIFRLDVAVHDPLPVGIVEGDRDLARQAQRLVHRDGAVARQTLAERLPRDVRHRVPQLTDGLTRVVDRQDVGMLEAGGELDFPQEPLWPERHRDLGMEHLQRDGAVVLQIPREVDDRHSPTAELPLDVVAVSKGLLKSRERLGQFRAGERTRPGTLHGPVTQGQRPACDQADRRRGSCSVPCAT